MVTAAWVSRFIYTAAKIGLADHLAAGPRSAAELAGELGAHAPSLHRFMRTLASLGLLAEQADQQFALTVLGEALQKGAPGSARSSVLTLHSPWFNSGLAEMEYSLETGETAFQKVHGMPVFEFLARHPEEASMFSETMVGVHGAEPAAVAAAYEFSSAQTIVDVGGATGNLLAEILKLHPEPRGILFDLPHVVKDAPALLAGHGVEARVSIEAGSFFETVPAGHDLYLLSHIIHDWSEEQCLAILGNVRQAMKPGSKLLLVEMVLPLGDAPHPGKLLDMVMLVLPGGQERTESEYAALLAKAGFRLNRLIPTASAASIVEAVLV